MAGSTHIALASLLLISTSAALSCAHAYTQDVQLERELESNDSRALALLPAEGFKHGAAGFFRSHALYVVPGSARAWCTDNVHAVLKAGCYVELYMQGNGLRPSNSRGDPCGGVGRWYRAAKSRRYVPTPGSFMANAIAKGEFNRVEFAIFEEPGTKSAMAGTCDRAGDTLVRRK